MILFTDLDLVAVLEIVPNRALARLGSESSMTILTELRFHQRSTKHRRSLMKHLTRRTVLIESIEGGKPRMIQECFGDILNYFFLFGPQLADRRAHYLSIQV